MFIKHLPGAIVLKASQLTGVGLLILDQAVLSALSLSLSIAFIFAGTKAEFSVYTLVSSGLLLGLGAHNAVIVTPLIVNGAKMNANELPAFRRQLVRIQLPLSVAIGSAGGAVALAFARANWSQAVGLAGAVLLGVVGGWLREFRRGEHILRGQHAALLVGDIVTVMVTALSVGILILAGGHVKAWTVLLFAGLANAATGLGPLRGIVGRRRNDGPLPLSWETLAGQVRWSLPGMFLSWVQSTAYPYFVALTSGAGAVAEVAAARLLINPGLLVNTAYARFLLPRMGAIDREGGVQAIQGDVRHHMRLATAAALVYVAGVVIFMVCGGQRLLPSEYHGVGMIAVVWTIVLAATATRTVPATALQAMARFRTLFAQGMIAAIVSALACLGLGIALRAPGCVAGVAIGEALLAILLWRQLHVQGGARSQALDGEGGKSRAETALG